MHTQMILTVFQRLEPSRTPLSIYSTDSPPSTPQSPLSTFLENSCVHSRHLTGMEIRCKCHLSRRVSTCRRPGNLTGVCLSLDWTTFSSSLEKLLLGKQGGAGIVDVNCGCFFFFFWEDHYHLLVLWRLSVETVEKSSLNSNIYLRSVVLKYYVIRAAQHFFITSALLQ